MKLLLMRRRLLLLAGVLAIFCWSCEPKDPWPVDVQKSGLVTDSAMVVSAHPLASEVGAKIMKQGGNAIDAAVAVHFALAVVYPVAGNIGGGGFMVIRESDGKLHTLDYREKAPALATRNMYLDSANEVIENLSLRGSLAAGVPGSVAGMVEAHAKLGTMPWEKLVQPAIDLAENGFLLTAREARMLNNNQENFRTYNTVLPENVMKSTPWKEGDKIYYKDLAETLKRVRDKGRDGFYDGETARLIVEEMKRGNGIITLEDLKNYQAVWRPALQGEFLGYKIIGMPPPSSGGVALLQLLSSVEHYGIDTMSFQGSHAVHLMIEAERRVYADRSTHLGDADFWDVPVNELIEPAYNISRMEGFAFDTVTSSLAVSAGDFQPVESEETTHFSIVDPFGIAVSSTTTINGGFGCKVFVGGAGFLLNNEMDDFSIKPGFPNYYGLIGGEANAIEPQKRMLSSMTPTIVEKDGQLKMVVGTPGGSTIITSVFQTVLNVLAFDMSMQDAVDAPRFHHQWLPDTIYSEADAINIEERENLSVKGHFFSERSGIGKVDAILILENGKRAAGADRRGDDSAAGY